MSGRERGGHQLSPFFKVSQFADDGVLFTASMHPKFKITIVLVYIRYQQRRAWYNPNEVVHWTEEINSTWETLRVHKLIE